MLTMMCLCERLTCSWLVKLIRPTNLLPLQSVHYTHKASWPHLLLWVSDVVWHHVAHLLVSPGL
jgi:hypothetical protein